MTERQSNVLPGSSVLAPLKPRPAASPTPPSNSTPKQATREPGKKATADRFASINDFIDVTMRGLTRNESAVWLVLWRDTRNGTARTGQTDIAKRAGISRRTVIRTISRLGTKGLLTIIHRGGLNSGVNVYRVQPLIKSPEVRVPNP